MVKVVAFDGKHKIADRWEDTPYIVLQQPNNNVPVFKVKREDGEGRCKTLHRNVLLPIGSKLPSPVPPPRHRVQSNKSELPNTQRKLSQVDCNSQEGSDEDDIYDGFIVHAGTGNTTVETHSDQEDAPDISFLLMVNSQESIDADQTIEETESYEDVTDLDTESSETEPSEHSQCEEDPMVPEPAPRRTTRNAHQPKRMKDYVMSEQAITKTSSPEWLQRAAYLQELMVSGMLSSDDKQVTTALVSIIAGKYDFNCI